MDDLTLETVTEDGIDNLVAVIQDGFDAIPVPADIAPYQSIPFAIALRHESGRVEGAVTGHSVWDWLYVKYLWVADAHRGCGLGKGLLDAAESEALQRGCLGVWLNTMSFQAPAFYERQGYKKFGEIDDFPEGHTRVFYQKRLTPKPDEDKI